ncbi:MAG TPA: hypothetical protein VHY58_17955 [Streptosporangiaceae bacterium]|nr:hypothetical protein [Streptosporangiaceae bacterium]
MSPPPGAATPVVGVADLARELAEGPVPVLLDVRWRLAGPPGLDSYRAGHLPGAVFVDLDRDLSGAPSSRTAGRRLLSPRRVSPKPRFLASSGWTTSRCTGMHTCTGSFPMPSRTSGPSPS